MRTIVLAALLTTPLWLHAEDPFAENIRTTSWLSPADEQKRFRLPPGFEIQLFASEPDILKPMNMAFDARGRLWVTVTREYPYPVPVGKPGRDAIKILEDTDGDGKADKITTFADGLNIPTGLYPTADGCIVWSIPNVWRFRDTDGDGVADQREVLFGPFDHTRDTHGNISSFRRGFDGWLYATHGYNNNSVVRGRDGHEVRMSSGNTFRMRLDGSRLEQNTWGQVNPFGMAFDAEGGLYTSDCHSEPIYQLLAGGYYPSFGKPHDGLGFAPTLMESPRGSTALDGISIASDDRWPADFFENFFIGDVMASRIYRDRPVLHGSTRGARAMPDLVTTDDPWFRPVDTQLGPDGALYVADFYNRIIGHYEVKLDHPGRDRTSGRIWRIIYRGADGQPRVHPRLNLATAAVPELLAALTHPNIKVRLLAMDQLTDRVGAAAVPAVQSLADSPAATANQCVAALWVLHRLQSLPDETLLRAGKRPEAVVRTHVMRILAEKPEWTAPLRALAEEGLQDSNALVQRCSAFSLGRHPVLSTVAPLLALRAAVPVDDTHLLYVVRQSLRNHLNDSALFRQLRDQTLSEADMRALADVAPGVQSAEAGEFLLRYAELYRVDRTVLTEYLRHAARYATSTNLDTLARIVRARFLDEPDLQLALLKSILQGLDQRGAAPTDGLKQWAGELCQESLAAMDEPALTWMNAPLDGAANTKNPWFLQRRRSADGGAKDVFLCSLPPGGEALTGVLRSKPFTIPAELSFWVAGHDGPPENPPQKKNVIRLRRADTGEICAETYPPRNDLAQKFTWNLKSCAGSQGLIEVTDADTGNAYAWLAVGRFDGAVPAFPALSPNLVGERQLAVADIALRLHLDTLSPMLARIALHATAEPEARAGAARALASWNPNHSYAALAPLLGDLTFPPSVRDLFATAVVSLETKPALEALLAALKTGSQRAQIKMGLALAATPEGCEILLQAVKDGQAPARVLLDRALKDKIAGSRPADGTRRLTELTQGLAPATDQIQKLIDQRRDTYRGAQARMDSGQLVFTKNCAPCHSIGGQGGNVGPQLDGIGQRGLDRLCEDVLDPNRNVDRAFRTSLVTLKEGDVVTGLVRREEGELLILADSTGKEISVPKKNIAERRETETSLMPDNFGEAIPLEDFNHLMAFLLSKAVKP